MKKIKLTPGQKRLYEAIKSNYPRAKEMYFSWQPKMAQILQSHGLITLEVKDNNQVWASLVEPEKNYSPSEVRGLMLSLIEELDLQGILDNANDAKDEAIKLIDQYLTPTP